MLVAWSILPSPIGLTVVAQPSCSDAAAAGANLQGMPGMHQHTLQVQQVQSTYTCILVYIYKKETKETRLKWQTDDRGLQPIDLRLFSAHQPRRPFHFVGPWLHTLANLYITYIDGTH